MSLRLTRAVAAALGMVVVAACSTSPDDTPLPDPQAPSFTHGTVAGTNEYDLMHGGAPLPAPDQTTRQLTINDARWQWPVPAGVGTGNLNPFWDTHSSPTSECFNTGAKSLPLQCARSSWTNALPLNKVPVFREPGTSILFRELVWDMNEPNSSAQVAQLSIDFFRVYVCANTAAKDYTELSQLAACSKVYSIESGGINSGVEGRGLAWDASTQGSGRDLDYRILIPNAAFTAVAPVAVASCPYDPAGPDCGVYVIVHSRLGGKGRDYDQTTNNAHWETTGGFEEMSTVLRGYARIDKTVVTTFTRTYRWRIEKSVSPTVLHIWDGESSSASWTVNAIPDGHTDTDWRVSGNITVTNPSGSSISILKPTDVISGGAPAPTVRCPAVGTEATFPLTLAAGASLVCSYSASLVDGSSRTNTAAVELTDGGVTEVIKPIVFGAPTNEVNKTVDVTDTYPHPGGTASALGTATHGATTTTFNIGPRTINCPTDKGTKVNRATITQTGQTADATLTVNCYTLNVTKTATPARATTYAWTILKQVSKKDAGSYSASTSFSMQEGDLADVTYRVELTRSVTSDVFSVGGVITIANPSTSSGNVVVRNVADAITPSPGGTATITACTGGAIPVTATTASWRTLLPNSQFTCDYTFTFASAPSTSVTYTNTATVIGAKPDAATKSFSGTAEFSYAAVTPTITGSASVTLTDPNDPSSPRGPFSADQTITYNKTWLCTDGTSIVNTASINTNPVQSSQATVNITCYTPTVTKTATTTFTRSWDWKILKEEGNNPNKPMVDGVLTLALNQTYDFNYKVTVSVKDATWPRDSEWKTKGTLRVNNLTAPAGTGVKIIGIVDTITAGPFAAAVSNCRLDNAGAVIPTPSAATPYVLDGGKFLQCDWAETSLPNANGRTNTATAVKQDRRHGSTVSDIAASTRSYSGTAAVTFGSTPTKKVDNCVKVTDTVFGDLFGGTPVCENDAPAPPKVFTYTVTLGNYTACGPYNVPNIASFTSAVVSTNATPVTGSSSFNVPVNVPCEGCTLTQGYWKTHNESFWGGASKKADPAWDNLPLKELSGFFTTAAPPSWPVAGPNLIATPFTWFSTFWTAPRGNSYYNLAHQYMAAKLNVLNGAPPSGSSGGISVADILAAAGTNSAQALFVAHTPAAIGALRGNDPLRAKFITLAGVLGSYNEGLIGPGHCDEDATSAP